MRTKTHKNNSYPNLDIEFSLCSQYKLIAGTDEAGRGPLAGPVVAASVILNDGFDFRGINDSKKLSEKNREELYFKIMEECSVGIGIVDNNEIDEINILQATLKAMKQSIENLREKPDFLLIDGNYYKDISIPFKTIIKGDALSASIAAASIIAKVTRDRWIYETADKKYPQYEFAKHKGYATSKHFNAIDNYGLTEYHRRSFLRKYFALKSNDENSLFGNSSAK